MDFAAHQYDFRPGKGNASMRCDIYERRTGRQTASSGDDGSVAMIGIQGVAQAVAEEVEGQDYQNHRQHRQ